MLILNIQKVTKRLQFLIVYYKGYRKIIPYSDLFLRVVGDSVPYKLHCKNKYIRVRAKPVINSALRITNSELFAER